MFRKLCFGILIIGLVLSLIWIWKFSQGQEDLPFFNTGMQKEEKNNRSPKKPNPLKLPRKPASPQLKTPKTKLKVDFILISPDPVFLSPDETIILQAYGFAFKKPEDTKPISVPHISLQKIREEIAHRNSLGIETHNIAKMVSLLDKKPPIDPLSPKTREFLEKKYHYLGPVSVLWKKSYAETRLYQKKLIKPLEIPEYQIIPDEKDPSKATLVPLRGTGYAKMGIIALLKENPNIRHKSSLLILNTFQSSSKKNRKKHPLKLKVVELRKYIFLKIKGIEGDKIYGELYYNPPSGNVAITDLEGWDKILLKQALDLKDHQSFLEDLKKNNPTNEDIAYYEYRLITDRYRELERFYRIYKKEEWPQDGMIRLARKVEKELKLWIEKAKLAIESSKNYKDPYEKFYKGPTRGYYVLESIKKKDKDYPMALNILTRDKELRNQLYPEIRRIFENTKKDFKDKYWFSLFGTLIMMGVATPQEEEEFKNMYIKSKAPLPKWWNYRHSRWR